MSVRREVALHHCIVRTRVLERGQDPYELQVLFVLQGEKAPEPMVPLMEYVVDTGHLRALTWQRKTVQAVGMFVDFAIARRRELREGPFRKVFGRFAEALVRGTIDEQGNDANALYWEPKTVGRAKEILRAVTAFSEWAVNRYGARPLNPKRPATLTEQIATWRQSDQRRAHALLGYAVDRETIARQARTTHSVKINRTEVRTTSEEVKSFPEQAIGALLREGFVRQHTREGDPRHVRLNLKDILITMLLHGAGLRLSEPFHLFVSDIEVEAEHPERARVKLYHPEQGGAPVDYVDPLTGRHRGGDREEYLRGKWQRKPRTLEGGRFHAGWKDLLLMNQREKYALIHWFPTDWGEIFLDMAREYITHCRSKRCNHPYLFVSEKRGVEGDPYTIDAFRQAHAKAVRRIGLEAGRQLGTTPHGHRHAYGRRLKQAEVDAQTIQRVMHHKGPGSQDVYTEPAVVVINATLEEASKRLEALQTPVKQS